MKKIVSIAALVLAVSCSTAIAAQPVAVLVDTVGKVRMNVGEGFVAVPGAVDLKVGDKVMVGAESKATIMFGDCRLVLEKPAVFTVKDDSVCKNGVQITPTADVYVPPVVNNSALVPALVVGIAAAGVAAFVILDDDASPEP